MAQGNATLMALLRWAEARQTDARSFKDQAVRASMCNAYAGMQREIRSHLGAASDTFFYVVRSTEDDDVDLFEHLDDARDYADIFEGSIVDDARLLDRPAARDLIEDAREGGE